MPLSKLDILQQLRKVSDPQQQRDLVSLDMVKNIAYCDGLATITLESADQSPAYKQTMQGSVTSAVRQLGDEIKQVVVQFTAPAKNSPQKQVALNNPLPGVKNIFAVGAGKGGVGKSTVSVNLAVGLARTGVKVGLLDGDIYGPSMPTLLNIPNNEPPPLKGTDIIPFETHGIKAMTIGAIVESEKPLIWRGPMAHGAFKQLATQTLWGELDYLVIDLPPGTGDVPLTMSQVLPLAGAVVVCTPQKVAQDDARRAVRMFQQLDIEVLGVVENMSYFIGDDGKEYDIFGRGGAQVMAAEMGVPFLGMIPINMRLRANSDRGNPTANFEDDRQLGEALEAMTRNVAGQLSIRRMDSDTQAPTISIS